MRLRAERDDNAETDRYEDGREDQLLVHTCSYQEKPDADDCDDMSDQVNDEVAGHALGFLVLVPERVR